MTDAAPGTAPGAAVHVHALVVEVGRKPGDGLPEGATGAALLCYVAARDETAAVRETVETLRQAGLAPLEVTAHDDLPDPELEARARTEDAVIVAQVTHFRD
jgi:hypothetical protein